MNILNKKLNVKKDRYFFRQIPCEDSVQFKQYKINTKVCFDHIYFPEKDKIKELINKTKTGELKKLSLLLHGEPGCGKTSIIKAIATEFNYDIIEVKLSLISSDAYLADIFHSDDIVYCDAASRQKIYKLPVNRRIYILEDIDAECNVIHKRNDECDGSDKDKDKVSDPIDISLKKKMYEKMMSSFYNKGLTLSGILNTFDGVLEVNGCIIIMTTNHPEKLDPAFIRPGRITINLELKKMTAKNANEMIIKRYGRTLSDVIDYEFTPATLESYCQIATNIKELHQLIVDSRAKNFI